MVSHLLTASSSPGYYTYVVLLHIFIWSHTVGKTSKPRRTQAERRAHSKQAVLESACRLFGEKGFADTSLEDISADCGLTIRPVYHYFGNKKALFAAVNEHLSAKILDTFAEDVSDDPGEVLRKSWRAFLDLCDDPGFRRVVLIDGPNILGRQQWGQSTIYLRASEMVGAGQPPRGRTNKYRFALMNRVMMGAMAEAALMVAESDDISMAKREAERLVMTLFSRLQDYQD
jgi:AcrR family transcriptional regulator